MIKKFCFIITVLIGSSVCYSQPFYHDWKDGFTTSSIASLIDFDGSYVVGANRENGLQISKYSNAGIELSSYLKLGFGITSISKLNENLFVFASKYLEWHADSFLVIVLDSSLNVLKEIHPAKSNWPRPYFRSRTFIDLKMGENIAYFGRFFNDANSFSDSTSVHGWLILSSEADSMVGVDLNTNYQGIQLLYCFPSGDGFYGIDPVTSISYPWSPSTSVTSIAAFDDSMRWLKTINFGMPSNLPGFPRLIRSADTRNLAINEHSVYAVAQYEALPPLIMGETRKSCAVYRFDRELNRMQVVHDTAVSGKVAETHSPNFPVNQIIFDQHKTHLYVLWRECDPRLSFNDQTRECATVVLKYDTALNLIWRRKFAFPEMYFYGEHLISTADGGVLIAGFYIDLPPAPNIKNVFVLKLDSIGNHVVSIPSEDVDQPGVLAYPNPATDVLQLKWQNIEFDQLIIHDLQGRLIWQQSLQLGTTQTAVHLHDWTKGVYFYRLRGTDGSWRHGKYIKQ
jgi:hypothetical protein